MFIEGERLTSSSQGFKVLSIKISNPNNSKQLLLKGACISKALQIVDSIEMIVLTIKSSILSKINF